VVGLPLISLTKEEVKVEKTNPLEGDVGGGSEEEEGGDVVVEREGDEVLKSVETRVRVSKVGEKEVVYVYDEGVGVGVEVYSLSEVEDLKYGMGESSRIVRMFRTKSAPVI
jgi:hypothetical protein